MLKPRPSYPRVRLPARLAMVLPLLFGVITNPAVGDPGSAIDSHTEVDQIRGNQSGLVHTLTIPLDDGGVDIGRLLADLLEQVGLDGHYLRRQAWFRIDVHGTLGGMHLEVIQRLTRGVMTFHADADRLSIQIDRLMLRRHEKSLRRSLRETIETWFPEQAQAAAEQYGIFIQTGADQIVRPNPGHLREPVVLLVHGLDDPGAVWTVLASALIKEGYTVARFEYPNDQPIEASARLLAEELEKLRSHGAESLSVVAHSMGGLVSREVLTHPDFYAGDGRGGETYPSVTRLIMVATPNHGSHMARLQVVTEVRDQIVRALSGQGLLFGSVFDGAGEAKLDLLPRSDFLTDLNARPHAGGVQMTVIASIVSPVTAEQLEDLSARLRSEEDSRLARGVEEVTPALQGVVNGLGDGVVSLASTRLEGVDDHVTVTGNHLTMIRNLTPWSTRVPPAVPVILERLGSGH